MLDVFGAARESENSVLMSEIISAMCWQRYENEVLVAEGENSLGEIPLVHIQNTGCRLNMPERAMSSR